MNYARYLTFFEFHLINIEHSHPSAKDLLRNRAFSVARSFTPGNRAAVDKTMEETFMKHAKSRGGASTGLIGITQNHEAYQRWVRTSHERVKYVERTLEMAEMYHSEDIGDVHREVRNAAVLKSEESVQRTINAIQNLTSPFSVEPGKLVSLASGAIVPPEKEKDVLRAEEVGNTEKERFIKERLKNKEKSFFDPNKQ